MTDIRTSPEPNGRPRGRPGRGRACTTGPSRTRSRSSCCSLGALILGRKLGVNAPLIILGIAVMIFFHELGHFITAKWTGMKATEFFLGFGPTLWSFRRGETEYGLKLIPAGAYVKIIGMHNLEEVDPADEPRAYRQKTYPRRVLVASAGSVMHFIMATVLFFICFAFIGVPDENKWYVRRDRRRCRRRPSGSDRGRPHPVDQRSSPSTVSPVSGPVLAPLYDQPLTMDVLRDGQQIQIVGHRRLATVRKRRRRHRRSPQVRTGLGGRRSTGADLRASS